VRILVACAVVAGCAAPAPGPGIDVARALEHVQALVALGPHPGDSPEAQRAAAYIAAQLPVERVAVGTVALPAIDVLGRHVRDAQQRITTDPDLVVRYGPRAGRALLVMAHYDTVATSPGAVDNAAGVAVAIELARALAAAPPAIPVAIAFTANEEIGLVGAEALAARESPAFAVALDLIGGSGDLSLNGASKRIGRAELRWLARAADRAGVVLRAPLPHRVVSRAWPAIERSDHGPFTRRGVPAVHLYNRGQDGEWIDLAYHSPRDVAARVDRGALAATGRLLRALTETPPPAPDGDGFWLPLATNTVVPRGLLVGACGALAALALGLLTALRTIRARGGLGLVAGVGVLAVATAITAGVERLALYPGAYLHAPGPAVLAELALLAGLVGLLATAARRFAPWAGDRRYLAAAIALPLAIGLPALLADAAELAWIWLVPAAALALAPRLGRLGLVALPVTLLPGALILLPNQLREAAWNGFWPVGVPLAVWVAANAASPLAALAWWLRRAPSRGPLGALVLPMGCTLATLAGAVVLLCTRDRCTARQFREFSLACEVAPRMR
jgi:hypothetical protein